MVGTTEAITLGMDALQTYFGKLQTELKLLRNRPAPSRWHVAAMEGIKSTAHSTRPDTPTWSWPNPRRERIAVRRIQVLLDDAPSETYQPNVQIAMNDVPVLTTRKNALKVADIDLDLGEGGKYLEIDHAVTVTLWNGLADASEVSRAATVYLQAGEL